MNNLFQGKKIFLICLLVFLTASVSVADNTGDISSLLNLDITLKELSGMSYGELENVVGEYVILTGSVASRTVLDPDAENFTAQLELIDGEWQGTSQVYMYQCLVFVQGPEWVERIPARRSRNKSPDEIELSSNIMVIGRILPPQTDENGTLYRIIEGLHIREIQ